MNRSQLRKRLMIIAKHTNDRLNGSTPQSLAATPLRRDRWLIRSRRWNQKLWRKMKMISKLCNLKRIVPAGHQLWRQMLVLPAGMVLLAGCGKAHQGHTAAQPDLPSVQVCTQMIEAKPLASIEEVVGTMRARLRATIEAKANGRITDMP